MLFCFSFSSTIFCLTWVLISLISIFFFVFVKIFCTSFILLVYYIKIVCNSFHVVYSNKYILLIASFFHPNPFHDPQKKVPIKLVNINIIIKIINIKYRYHDNRISPFSTHCQLQGLAFWPIFFFFLNNILWPQNKTFMHV